MGILDRLFKKDEKELKEIASIEDAETVAKRATAFHEKGDYADAIKYYTQLLNAPQGFVDRYAVLQERGMAFCENGNFNEAERDLEEVLQVLGSDDYGGDISKDSQAMYWLMVARHKGDKKKAMDEFVKL
ncbi:MAG TPA: tetratricopeptide repeat protein [Desulfobacteria bacterium]|nr:tetratricopeptide repeat protein [Desulfobacteria bacterium]